MIDEVKENIERDQYLTFDSAGEIYAIGILQVKEIIPFEGATKVPMAPSLIAGLINLRGKAVPVIDLAIKFGQAKTLRTNRTCVIIVDVTVGKDEVIMGILTDSVRHVIDVPKSEIDEAPNFGTGLPSQFLSGLAKVEDSFIPIIHVKNVLTPEKILEAIIHETPNEEEVILSSAKA